jgi:hypothetical protein
MLNRKLSYRNKMKIKLMREAVEDFKKDLDKEPKHFFTKKENFYFIRDEDKKYIHKKSLRMIYTNYDTYTYDLEPETCMLTKQYKPLDLCLLGLPEASKNFYIVNWLEGEQILSLEENDYFHLKDKWKNINFTPFYNQMAFNLVKNENGIFIIDYKHFENKRDLPFFVYFYNKDFNINILYYEKNENDLEKIKDYLSIDYPIEKAELVDFTKR